MAQYTVGTHNLLYTLRPDKWREDLNRSALADVTGYQEVVNDAARITLEQWARNKAGRRLFMAGSVPISWNTKTMGLLTIGGRPFQGIAMPHDSAPREGVNARFNPERYFSYAGLFHRGTKQRILHINVHPAAQATKPEKDTNDSVALSKYKDWAIGQYWLDVLSFVTREMSRDRGKGFEMFWDGIVLLGDFNATLNQRARWYYPAYLLQSVFLPDPKKTGLDHIMRTRGSDLVHARRWQVPANSDHDIHFQKFTIKEQVDFPRQA